MTPAGNVRQASFYSLFIVHCPLFIVNCSLSNVNCLKVGVEVFLFLFIGVDVLQFHFVEVHRFHEVLGQEGGQAELLPVALVARDDQRAADIQRVADLVQRFPPGFIGAGRGAALDDFVLFDHPDPKLTCHDAPPEIDGFIMAHRAPKVKHCILASRAICGIIITTKSETGGRS